MSYTPEYNFFAILHCAALSTEWLLSDRPCCKIKAIVIEIFSKLSTSRSQFVGQILNSDLASSYTPFNTPTVFVFLPVLHPNRSFEISMTIVLILQQGLSESSRSRDSLLHSAMYLSLYLCICLFFDFAFASVAGRAWSGYCLTAALLSTTRIVIIIIK